MTRVLIIDDDFDVRDQVATTLLAAYYETYTAVDGQDGVAKALSHVPDLIICDMMMPNMNGQQVLETLRQHPETASIPFIFLTAVDTRTSVRESMDLGADDYLFKPFQVNELLKAVSARLKHHQQIMSTAEQQLELIKTRLARTITHELRTPVGLLVGSLQMLLWTKDEAFSQESLDMLNTMNYGANRLAHVVEQMVFATHLTTGLYSAQMIAEHGIPLEISELIQSAQKSAQQFTVRPAPNVSIKLTELQEAWYIKADPGSLKHALAEVISNALAFSPENGTVRISYKQIDHEVRITITDSGEGIPDDKLKEALSWFGQIDRDLKEQQGMGLGLPLAAQLFEIHGGSLEIHSIVGKGTQAVITLPITPNPY